MTMEYHETMSAVMAPDVYDGPNCDQIRPQWYASAEGDKGDGDHSEAVTLAADTFPPGTKIKIEVPCCPDCHTPADFSYDPASRRTLPCECGFDWEAWARDEYS